MKCTFGSLCYVTMVQPYNALCISVDTAADDVTGDVFLVAVEQCNTCSFNYMLSDLRTCHLWCTCKKNCQFEIISSFYTVSIVVAIQIICLE